MKYRVEIGDRTYEVEVGSEGVRIDGRPVEADLRSNHGSELRHLVLDGRSHTIRPRPAGGRGEWEVEVDGRVHRVVALDERRAAIRDVAGLRAAAEGPVEIRAPMPGLIVAVEVAEGAEVEPGQGVLVIEAMKMENELKAEMEGRVSEVRVSSGQTVEKGETLLVIEPPPGGSRSG